MTPRRRALFAGAAAGLACILALAGLELGLRVLRPDLHPETGNVLRRCHVFDPVTGWRPAADCAGRFVKEDFDTQVRTNRHGLRGAAVADAPAPGVTRIAVLGDSFAWGYGVNDDETFAAHLQRLVPATEVLNAGVSGYGTDQAYLRYRDVVRPFGSRVVILAFFADNDFANNMEGRSKPEFRPYFAFDADGVLAPRNLPLPERAEVLGPRPQGFDELAQRWSFAYRFLYLKAKLLSAQLKQQARIAGLRADRRGRTLQAAARTDALPLYAADPPAETAESISITLGLLSMLHDAVTADGAELVMLLIPQRVQVVRDEWQRELRRRNLDPAAHDPARPHRLVRAWAADRGVVTLDLYGAFLDDPAAASYYLRADRHFSARGHARCAELLAPLVAPLVEP